MSGYIGKVYPSYFRYFDKKLGRVSIKSRPVLIIGDPITTKDTEYVVLPVSSLLNQSYYQKDYDVLLEKNKLINSTLNRDSYVRTHKRTVMYRADIDFTKCIVDLKNDYKSIFSEIVDKMEKYDSSLAESAKK